MEKVVIGLEVHVQLNTKTKMFCGCSMDGVLDAEPNSRTCETCLGMPGSKPRVNAAAIEAGIKIALALSCKIRPEIFFSRKSYFYPDMSKNFQITQYEIPIAESGYLDVDGKRIRIKRLNLEEDPAKLIHVGSGITEAKYVLIDYNRSGIPLCEIVTEPDISSPREARIFLQRLLSILEYLGVYKSGEFGIKADANISLEIDGKKGSRVEVKNITGFKEIEKAFNYEIVRQRNLLKKGEVKMETRAWDAVAKVTRALRAKETEEDYGYIFEPDLTFIEISKEKISSIQKIVPELPQQKMERYMKGFGISKELAVSITGDMDMAQFYESAVRKVDPKILATWMLVLKKTLNFNDLSIREMTLDLDKFVKLLKLIDKKELSERAGELVLRDVILSPEKMDELIGKYKIVEKGELEDVVKKVLGKNKKAVEDYKSGESKALQFLVGQVVRETKGKADAKDVKNLIEKYCK